MTDTLPCAKLSDLQATDLISVMAVSYQGETVILNPHDPWPKFTECRVRMNVMLARIDQDALRNARGRSS
jgi:hypothetical protein